MIKLLFVFTILLAPSWAFAQCNGVFPASTLCGTASTAGVPSPVPLGTFLSSANNNAPVINIFNTSTTAVCCTGQLNVISSRSHITGGGGNAIVGSAIQDDGSIATFPTGVTGYGLITAAGAGSYVFGIFGRADITTNGSANNEVNCNNTNADSPSTFPPNLAYPVTSTYCIGFQSVNIGTNKSHSAFRSVATGGLWLASYYADPISSSTYGLFIDSDTTNGPISSAYVRNTGSGVHLTLQTMGTFTPANPVIQSLDVSSNIIWRLNQSGAVAVNSATAGNLNYAITNTDTGNGSTVTYSGTTNAGSILMQATTIGAGSGSTFRWTGAGSLFIDALNASGNVVIRAGTVPTSIATFTVGTQLGAPTGGDKGAGTLNVQGAYYQNGTIGVTCSGSPTVSFASTLGIVTHC